MCTPTYVGKGLTRTTMCLSVENTPTHQQQPAIPCVPLTQWRYVIVKTIGCVHFGWTKVRGTSSQMLMWAKSLHGNLAHINIYELEPHISSRRNAHTLWRALRRLCVHTQFPPGKVAKHQQPQKCAQ